MPPSEFTASFCDLCRLKMCGCQSSLPVSVTSEDRRCVAVRVHCQFLWPLKTEDVWLSEFTASFCDLYRPEQFQFCLIWCNRHSWQGIKNQLYVYLRYCSKFHWLQARCTRLPDFTARFCKPLCVCYKKPNGMVDIAYHGNNSLLYGEAPWCCSMPFVDINSICSFFFIFLSLSLSLSLFLSHFLSLFLSLSL